MGAPVLMASSVIQCAHGATASAVPGQARVFAGGQPVLVQTDRVSVAGCPFQVPPTPTPSPCVQVVFSSASTRVRASGVPILTQGASAQGMAAAPQGPVRAVTAQ